MAMRSAQSNQKLRQSSSFALAPSTTLATTSPAGISGAITAPNYLWPWAITSTALSSCNSSCTLFIGELRAPNNLIPLRLPCAPGVAAYHRFLLYRDTGAISGPTATASDGTPLGIADS